MFGNDASGDSLKRMAEIAETYHEGKPRKSNSLWCGFHKAKDGEKLAAHLNQIVVCMRQHRPTLIEINDE